MDRDNEKRIRDLEKEVKRLSDVIGVGFDRNMNPENQDVLRELIQDKIYDIVWDDYFYIHEFFYTTTGFQTASSTSSVSFGVGGVDMITGTSSGDYKELAKQMANDSEFVKHDRITYFRVNAYWGETTNQTSYIRTLYNGFVGASSDTDYSSAVGFKVHDGTLYGIAQGNEQETESPILNITADEVYELELRYFPYDRVDFYVDGTYRTSISTNLPDESDNNVKIFDAFIQTDAASEQKDLHVEYYQFLQKRKAYVNT